MTTDHPTEEQIREALEDAEVLRHERTMAVPNATTEMQRAWRERLVRSAGTLLHLARLGAQQIRRETAEITHYPGCWREHHGCAVAVVKASRDVLRASQNPHDISTRWRTRRDALLAHIDPETETDDG